MSKENIHPQYLENAEDLRNIRLAQKGERHIRNAKEDILPKTAGMKNKTMKNASDQDIVVSVGADRYNSYISRARFYPVVDEYIDGILGIAFENPLECSIDLKTKITKTHLSIPELVQQVVEEVALVGRYILVNDLDHRKNKIIVQYSAESLVNWADDENGNLAWCRFAETYDKNNNPRNRDMKHRYREYKSVNGGVEVSLLDEKDKNIKPPIFMATPLDEHGNNYFPVTVIGSRNNRSDFDKMPSLKIVEAVISAYKLSADQRLGFYGQAQPTPTATGISTREYDNFLSMGMGVGSFWATTEPNAKFGMLEYEGSGIEQITKEIKFELSIADKHSVRVAETSGVEATKTVEIRTNAQRATIWTMFNTISNGIQRALTIREKWLKPNSKEVLFSINTDFTAKHAEAQMITAISNAVLAEELPKGSTADYVGKTNLLNKSAEDIKKDLIKEDDK